MYFMKSRKSCELRKLIHKLLIENHMKSYEVKRLRKLINSNYDA